MFQEQSFGQAFRTRSVADVEAELAALCGRIGSSGSAVDRAMSDFIAGFLDGVRAKGSQVSVSGMVALPLLVHGAETADPHPAKPLAVVHLLWWAGARYLDDFADDETVSRRSPVEINTGILAALGVGSHLAGNLLAGIPASDAVRNDLRAELSRGWLDAINGQLRDLTEQPTSATLESILRSYQGKTGAPYAMAAAMAARLAGCTEGRVDEWRAFGLTFGLLRQLINDQRDLVTGRNEDLRNGTATYLLVHYLRLLPYERRADALRLLAAAQESAAARHELSERMLEAGVIEGYADSITPLIRGAHDSIDALGGEEAYVRELHGLVDETAGLFPAFRLASVQHG